MQDVLKRMWIWIAAGLMAWSASTAGAQGLPVGEDMEVRGIVKLWAPAVQRIEVDGKTYRLARDVQVVDGATRLLPAHRVRPGVPVLLLITDGQFVTHVVVNPGPDSPFDRVGP